MRIMDQAHVVSAVPYEVEESFAWDEEARRAEAAKGRGPRTRLPGAQALPKATISVQDVVLRLRTPQDRLGALERRPLHRACANAHSAEAAVMVRDILHACGEAVRLRDAGAPPPPLPPVLTGHVSSLLPY